MMHITEQLTSALHGLVRATQAAEVSPFDRQAARRAIEQSKLVAHLAREEGFGVARPSGDTEPE